MLPSWITSDVTMVAKATTATWVVLATRHAVMETRTASSGALRWTRSTATTAVYATTTLNWPARTTPTMTAPSCESECEHPSFVRRKSAIFLCVIERFSSPTYGNTSIVFSDARTPTETRHGRCFYRSLRCDTMEPVVVYRRLNTGDKESAPRVARKLQKWRDNQRWKTIAKWQGDADNDVEPRLVSASGTSQTTRSLCTLETTQTW